MPNPTCPTNCGTGLPAVSFNDCFPQFNPSEFKRIFVTDANAPAFTDATSVTEWTARLDQTTVSSGKIRTLICTGNMPAPSEKEYAASNRRTHVVSRDRTLQFTIDEVSDENYDFMRTFECGGTYQIWVETWGKKIYGDAATDGKKGVLVNISPALVLGGGDTDVEKLEFVAKWKSLKSPSRMVSPIYQD